MKVKYLLSLSLLALATLACGDGSSGSNAPQPVPPSVQPGFVGQEFEMSVAVSSPYEVNDGTLSFLRSRADSKKRVVNGQSFDCSVSIEAGQFTYDFEGEGETLLIGELGDKFQRISGESTDSLLGSWKSKVFREETSTLEIEVYIVLTFGDSSVTNEAFCSYK